MLYYFSEDPWPLAYVLGLLSLGLLVALWVTRQGRYLVWAGAALAVGLAAFGIERAWVTDAERIEAVVYDLARAVQASDGDRVVALLAPEAELALGARSLDAGAIRGLVDAAKFDYVYVTRLRTNAGRLSRTGTAEFRAQVLGSVPTPFARMNYMTPPEGSEWSLGFRETGPGTWKVTRITPMNLPQGADRLMNPPGSRGRRGR